MTIAEALKIIAELKAPLGTDLERWRPGDVIRQDFRQLLEVVEWLIKSRPLVLNVDSCREIVAVESLRVGQGMLPQSVPSKPNAPKGPQC